MEFDYIVVGAGAAGCVVAGRLAAADPRRTVLLIEYGGRPVSPLLHVPKGFYYTLRGDRYLYRYQTQPVGPDEKREVWLRGRVLGGSAAVSGMMWTRGGPADWDGLAALGIEGWSWADVLPAYRAIEDHSLGASATRGAGGPVGVRVTAAGDEVTTALLASAAKYGWQHVADFNDSDNERIGFTPSTISRGRRSTSYAAFVRHGPGTRANLTVASRTRAGYLLLDGRRVTGVRVRDGSATARDVRARREVILSAGAVETPLLLERSGIGHPGVLRAAGIEPVVESPNVGERLIEQRGLALQVTLKEDIGPSRALRSPGGRVAAGLRYLLAGAGPLATSGYELACQFKSAPHLDRPDIQGLFALFALDVASEHLRLARHPGILFMGYPIRPSTTSSVHVGGADPDDAPVIDARFLVTAADRAAAAPVLSIVRELLGGGPVAELIGGEEFPGPAVAGPREAIDYSLRTGTGVYHGVGSAAMGGGDDAVTDHRLRVRGVEGLRVADASVLPVQVSGNTAAPAMLVGYRGADLILADAG